MLLLLRAPRFLQNDNRSEFTAHNYCPGLKSLWLALAMVHGKPRLVFCVTSTSSSKKKIVIKKPENKGFSFALLPVFHTSVIVEERTKVKLRENITFLMKNDVHQRICLKKILHISGDIYMYVYSLDILGNIHVYSLSLSETGIRHNHYVFQGIYIFPNYAYSL